MTCHSKAFTLIDAVLALRLLLQGHPADSALLLVCNLLSSHELLCVIPLVSKAFGAAAAATLGSRPFSVTSFQVDSSKAASLALWMQRHSAVLAHVQLCGFKSGVSPAWWHSICSAPFNSLQVRHSALHCTQYRLPVGLQCHSVTVTVQPCQCTYRTLIERSVLRINRQYTLADASGSKRMFSDCGPHTP
jgi:hypothetical protein